MSLSIHVRSDDDAVEVAPAGSADVSKPVHQEILRWRAWLLIALRHQRARRADLTYAAHHEPFNHHLERDRP